MLPSRLPPSPPQAPMLELPAIRNSWQVDRKGEDTGHGRLAGSWAAGQRRVVARW